MTQIWLGVVRCSATLGVLLSAMALGEGTVSASDIAYKFRVVESHDGREDVDPHIVVHIEGFQSSPPCPAIQTSLTIDRDNIAISLEDITREGICLDESPETTTDVPLPVPDGVYHLTIAAMGETDTYLLTIDSAIKLQPIQSSFSEADMRIFHRFPRNSLVFYCNTRPSEAFLCSDFIDIFTRAIPGEITFPAEGVAPFLGGPGPDPGRFFHYPDSEAWTAAVTIFEQYVHDKVANCHRLLELANWRNENHYSWVIEPNSSCHLPSPTPAPKYVSPLPTSVVLTGSPDTGGTPRFVLWGGVALAAAAALLVATTLAERRIRGRE